MKKFLLRVSAGILIVFLASKFIPGVKLEVLPNSNFFGFEIKEYWQILILVGVILGLFNAFLKPILDLITFPLKILTFGLFSIILNMLILFLLDILFEEFDIVGISPLFFSALLSMIVNFILKLIL
jgi:putative membrane protein